jgi:nicotinate-nucleotide--dimethylbenzimidazole phosphoribosyltransferase
MVQNFLHGGAAINVLARHIGARVVVVDLGVAVPLQTIRPDPKEDRLGRATSPAVQT